MTLSRRALKKYLKSEIVTIEFELLSDFLHQYPVKNLINPLFSFICSQEKVLCWRSISAFGMILPTIAADNMEDARVIMRRFLWSLNDESGGIGWGAPQAMASIMVAHDGLCEEYLHMLISYMQDDGPLDYQDGNYLELPMLQRGLLWGIGELCRKRPDLMLKIDIVEDLKTYLSSEDKEVIALSFRALKHLNVSCDSWLPMKMSGYQFEIYEDGKFITETIATFD